MPKKGVKTERPAIGDANDPESLFNHMRRFLRWQAEKNYSPKTIENREVYLRYFIQWCDERGLGRPQDITKPIIRALSALPVPVPQEKRRASEYPQPACARGADPRLVQVAGTTKPHPLQPGQ